MKDLNKIRVQGARLHNLKNVNVEIPKHKLVVFTGLSGSGKSSLAFGTIYAEGQRRYVESLSTYARQFLGMADKPDVEYISGLSPAISIDQKSRSHNPRSTVGTTTEIYDYLRLLYARIGKAYCPNGHGLIHKQTTKEVLDQLISLKEGTKILILAPIIKKQKGTHKNELERLRLDGFLRVRIDNANYSLDDEINLDKNKFHDIDIIVDRIIYDPSEECISRLSEALEVGFTYANGYLIVLNLDTNEKKWYSKHHSCKVCGFSLPKIEPRLFSFNSPIGACDHCNGIGVILQADEELIVEFPEKSIEEGAIPFIHSQSGKLKWKSYEYETYLQLCKYYDIETDLPYVDLDENKKNILMYGSPDEIEYTASSANLKVNRFGKIEGIASKIERRFFDASSAKSRDFYQKFLSNKQCPKCKGKRLAITALAIKVNHKNIHDITSLPTEESINFFNSLHLSELDAQVANLVLKEIISRLDFLNNVGLGYLELTRNSNTLSGGETQRIRLATQIGSQLSGVLYVLDEPSIGLHQRDNTKLLTTLKGMRDLGNTLIVVEHDEETIREAEYIVDIGPAAGVNGGHVVFSGSYEQLLKANTITADYMSGRKQITIPQKRRTYKTKEIKLMGCNENNLKNINVTIPLKKFIAVTGVSGSGKSTLINEILTKGIQKNLHLKVANIGKHKKIEGIDNIDKIINVSQDPIGRTPRSNPITYTNLFTHIRDLLASTLEARTQGFSKSRFSFNIPGGRCEKCRGEGFLKISMHFLPDVYVVCEECHAKRFNESTLKVKYRGKNIYEILQLNVDEALTFFEAHPILSKGLQILSDVGLGYIKIGQPATELSGGEAQRVKLATELMKKPTGKTIYVLDEPTTGLHFEDINKLLKILQRIVDTGDTVVVIEHNLDVIKCVDHVIDLGPEGGKRGGKVVATGTPEEVANNSKSITGYYIKQILNK